jgi:hypothetical protein
LPALGLIILLPIGLCSQNPPNVSRFLDGDIVCHRLDKRRGIVVTHSSFTGEWSYVIRFPNKSGAETVYVSEFCREFELESDKK